MSKLIDMTGKRYGRLVGIKRVGSNESGSAVWVFMCDCGKKVVVRGADVRNGHTTSCGCFHEERLKEVKMTHGMSKTRPYIIWNAMLSRCENVKNPKYGHYGGRGIVICKSWHKFENFWEDMGFFYKRHISVWGRKQTQIDRIDNNRGYSKDNCRWVTMREQANNRRDNHYLSFGGKTQTISQWAREKGMKIGTLKRRIYREWPVERALMAPVVDRQTL